MHPEYEEAEEHSDSHQGDGGRGGEELPVVDAKVPHHGQDHHEYRDHQAAGAEGHAGRTEPAGNPGHFGPSSSGSGWRGPGLGPVLGRRL